MTTSFTLPDDKTIELAEQVFDVIETQHWPESGDAGRFTIQRLFDYVTDAGLDASDLEAALEESAALRRDLRRLTAKIAGYHIPELAAAASGPVTRRVTQGCQVSFEASRAEPSQTYVVISLSELGSHPRWLAVFSKDNQCRRLALPEPRDGLIQLLMESGSDLLAALRDPDNEIFIDA